LGQVFFAFEALGVELGDGFGAGWPGGDQPFSVTTFKPPRGASLPGARVIRVVMGSPARSVACTLSGNNVLSTSFCASVARISMHWQIGKLDEMLRSQVPGML